MLHVSLQVGVGFGWVLEDGLPVCASQQLHANDNVVFLFPQLVASTFIAIALVLLRLLHGCLAHCLLGGGL